MQFEYIRGIMRTDGLVCVEYQIAGEETPKQVVNNEDLSQNSDKEIMELLRPLSPDFESPDYSKITIDRSWYNHAQGNHD